MKASLFLLFFVFVFANGRAQYIVSPNTYYVIPPTSGCNGLWAIEHVPGCNIWAINPCWSFNSVVGDTLFLNLCSIPCNYTSMSMGGDLCPTAICDDDPFYYPTAGFIANPDTSLCAGDSIQLINSSINALYYSWSVPGANPSTSADEDPYFQFPATGLYEITMTATSPGGGTDTEIHYMNVDVMPAPAAGFSSLPATVYTDDPEITLSNTSTDATTYSWNFGDGLTSADFEPAHTYTAAGIYEVMLIAMNGLCPDDTSWTTVEVVDNSALADQEIFDFRLHPNPTNGLIYITWPQDQPGKMITLSILDMRGRIVLQIENITTSEQLVIDLAGKAIQPGIYMIRVADGNYPVLHKLVLE